MEKKIGLTAKKAEKLLEKYGKNEVRRTKKISPIKIFISQFTSPLILILIAVAIVSLIVGSLQAHESNLIDVILILLIVLASGISGFIQEYRSEKTIEALQKMSAPKTRVIRDGKEQIIPARELVPGDVIILESGGIVPADAKIIESFKLTVDESILTGESIAVEKKLNDEIYMNTLVNVGITKALVINTGIKTKLGKIAKKLQEIPNEITPFESELDEFGKKISLAIVAVIFIIAVVSLLKYNLYISILIAVSLAVAAIPEGLPAVVTLTLAAGANAMSKSKALIRKLSVTESIGAVDIICTDKTGTLTKNEMTVNEIFFNNENFETNEINKTQINQLEQIFICAALCNNSKIIEETNKFVGDQTEVAIRKLSDKFGYIKEKLDTEFIRVNEIPFDSKTKTMSTVCLKDNKYFVYSKGAPEILIEKCDKILLNGKIKDLDKQTKQLILEQNKTYASDALRVLGFAYKETNDSHKDIEKDLIWLGLQAMYDPPREEVKKALLECKTAGIRVMMLTGDNPVTAKAIAEKINLESTGVITGDDLEKLTDKELEKKINNGSNIFARISPFDKLRILEILKKHSRVAMTGDGVNDALALKKADVGIAMAMKGTEVAKESSDIILLDDNFATITAAVKEGRRIFDNIRKFINYLFTCNFAEVAILLFATMFLALKEPILLPVHILWINLLTDGLPALALGVDPVRPNIMKEPPRKKTEPIIDKKLIWLIIAIGTKITILLLIIYFLILPMGTDVARTALFTGFILYEFVRIGSIRYQDKIDWLSNKWLILALLISFALQLIIIYTPLNKFFQIVPLGAYEWAVLIAGAIIAYVLAILITRFVLENVKE